MKHWLFFIFIALLFSISILSNASQNYVTEDTLNLQEQTENIPSTATDSEKNF